MKKLFALLALVCAGTLGAAEPPTGVAEYLTFSSAGTFSLATGNSTKNWDGMLYYSTDASTWTEWNGTSSIASSGNGELYLCGVENTKIGGDDGSYCFVLTGTAISCSGNIETLLDHKTVETGGTFTGDPEIGVTYYMEAPSLLTVHTDRLGATIAGTATTVPAGESITIDKPTVGAGETFMGWYVDGALRTAE